MKHEDLIKKLEGLKTPDIELPGHKQALRMALLNSSRFKQRTVMGWAKILAPVTAAVVVISVVGFFNVIQPRLEMAQARDIATNDLQVEQFMQEKDLEVAEVRVQNGEAYVLLGHQAAFLESDSGGGTLVAPAPEEGSNATRGATISGYILKVDLAGDQVTGVGQVNDVKGFQYINLDDIDFTDFEGLESEGSEEDVD
jgi:hypothetical protein